MSALADYFDDQARWRDLKAEEYPDDARNVRSATALRALAARVRALPADDPRLRQLAALDWPTDPFTAGEESGRLTALYGFHQADDPDAWLSAFTEACIRDWRHSR